MTDKQKRLLLEIIDPNRLKAPELPSLTHQGMIFLASREKPPMTFLEKLRYLYYSFRYFTSGDQSEAQQKSLQACTEQDYGHVLYPGSGFDTVPRDHFGSDNVVHVSHEERYFQLKEINDKKLQRKTLDLDVLGDLRAMPYKDGAFDTVYLKGLPAYMYLAGKKQGLYEIMRVLKPGGKLILSMFDHATYLLKKDIEEYFDLIEEKGTIKIYKKIEH